MTQTLVTAKELATQLGVTEETVYRWVNRRTVPFIRLPSRQVRFPIDEIMETWRTNPDPQEGQAA